MDPSYETVVDPQAMLGVGLAVGIHGLLLGLQLALAGFLLASGIFGLAFPELAAPWLRRLGATHAGGPTTRKCGALRFALGTALLAPAALGVPFAISLLASLGALVFLFASERNLAEPLPGRLIRRAAIGSAALVAAFIGWEREDALGLGIGIAANAQEWRVQELEWQLDHDRRSPKLGDLAPDFELQDPSGETAVRLSSFRDERPVALIFGSYT